jgi:hypothetical protein
MMNLAQARGCCAGVIIRSSDSRWMAAQPDRSYGTTPSRCHAMACHAQVTSQRVKLVKESSWSKSQAGQRVMAYHGMQWERWDDLPGSRAGSGWWHLVQNCKSPLIYAAAAARRSGYGVTIGTEIRIRMGRDRRAGSLLSRHSPIISRSNP